jgi:hypothetical protein
MRFPKRPRIESFRDYLFLSLGWIGGGLAFWAIASLLETEAVGEHHDWWIFSEWRLLGLGLGLAAVSLTLWCALHSSWRRLHTWVSRLGRSAAPEADIDTELTDPSRDYDILSTALLVIDTSRFSPRTVEDVHVGDGYYRRNVTREFVLPTATDPPPSVLEHLPFSDYFLSPTRDETTFLLPVLRFARSRGFLAGYLEVQTPDGQHVSTLNLSESYGVIEKVTEALTLSVTGAEELLPELRVAIDRMLQITRPSDSAPRASSTRTEITPEDREAKLAWIEEIPIPHDWAHSQEDWEAQRDRLYQFCEAVLDAHIVFAPRKASPGQRIVLAYSFTEPHKSRTRGFRDRVRYRIGLRPHEHQLSLTEHRWAQSYHLQFWAPPEQYVFESLVGPIKQLEGAPPGSIVEFAPDGRYGSDYLHVYIRETPRDEYRERGELLLDADCREKPPGMLGSVWVIAFSQAVLIWVVGYRHDEIFGSSDLGTDLPALLLAVPGLVVGWLGSQITGERMRVTSMATMLGLISCGLLAIFSTSIALSKASGDAFDETWVSHPLWLILMIVSAVLTTDLFLRMFIRGHRFSRRMSQKSRQEMVRL